MRPKIPVTSVIYKKLKKLDAPHKVQDFLNRLPFNFEERGETYRSVAEALKAGKAHCFEGALMAAAALWLNGEEPLLMDLRTKAGDDDHVVALFKRRGRWGAISKTNHAVLRFREPVYKSPRELAMSYFHEYFTYDGEKTLRKFSKPFNLSRTPIDWLASREDIPELVELIDRSPHEDIVPKGLRLRRADRLERRAGQITEYQRVSTRRAARRMPKKAPKAITKKME